MRRFAWLVAACLPLAACAPPAARPVAPPPRPVSPMRFPAPVVRYHLPEATLPAYGNRTVVVVTRAALSGESVNIGFLGELNPDCTAAGHVTVRVVAAPAHGGLTVRDGADYSNYPANTQRYACNMKKAPGMLVFYQSVQGYVGSDTARIEVIYPRGFYQMITYELLVR